MAVIDVSHSTFQLLQGIGAGIALLFAICAFIQQLRTQKHAKAEGKFKYYSTLFSSQLMIVCVIIYFTTEILWIFITDNNTKLGCYAFYTVELMSFSMFKLFLYFALVIRLIESYSQAHIYSNKLLISWQCWIITAILMTDILALLFVELDLSVSPCIRDFPTWLVGVFGTSDFILCVVNVVLFTIPLCKITRMIEAENSNNEMKTKFQYLTRKTCILGVLSVVSSLYFVSMAAVVNVAVFWLSIDSIVTVTCIILLFKRNDPIFDCCCGCCMGKLRKRYQSDSGTTSRFLVGVQSLLELSTIRVQEVTDDQLNGISIDTDTTKTNGSTQSAQLTQLTATNSKIEVPQSTPTGYEEEEP